MIELRRPPGQFARVGHRGAPARAPENTLRSLEVAVELGCDMLEFDVRPRPDGTLVLAHSARNIAPDVPTLDDVLAFAGERLPNIALQLDLKRLGIEERVVEALRRRHVIGRSWISCFDVRSLRRLAEIAPELPRSYTLPRTRLGRSPAARASLPRRLPGLLRRARASAATLHYSIASAAAIRCAHELDAAVYVWTVNDPRVAEQLVFAGADGIITDDPGIFATLNT